MQDIEVGVRSLPYTPVKVGSDHGEGSIVEWANINYSVQSTGKDSTDKQILKNINGRANPGELLAIMGTSGAGKSTLLDVLAGRLDAKGLTGCITVNGAPVNKRSFRRESGYVMQSDALYPLLTVRETFRFASLLRVPDKSWSEKEEIAENLIKLLRLDTCADTPIGNDQVRGVSGGEKRRVSIGVDIVHQPKVIFLDEPTSGLDSSTAYAVVESLKQLAAVKRCTIVMTIHQPSARIFELLDKVVFLSHGQVTYNGQASALLPFVSKSYQDLGYGQPAAANPPELFLDLSDKLHSLNQIDYLVSKFESPLKQSSNANLDLAATYSEVQYANSLFGEIYVLINRSLLNILRTKELFFARLGSCIFFAVLGGTLFLFPDNDYLGVYHKASFFILTLAYSYWTSLEALPIFYQERETFEREYASGAYRALSFTLAATLVILPFIFTMAFAYTAISWWLVSLPDTAERFLFQVLTLFIVFLTGNTFATFLSTVLPDPMTAQTIGSAIFAVMLVFSGFFIKRSDIPDYWIYFHYLSFFKYAIDSELVNGLQGYAHTATQSNFEILQSFSVEHTSKWQGVGVLLCWNLFYRSLFYFRLITAFDGRRKS